MRDRSTQRGERHLGAASVWLRIPDVERVWSVISMAGGFVTSSDGTTSHRERIDALMADTHVLVLTLPNVTRYLKRHRVGIARKEDHYKLWHWDLAYRQRPRPEAPNLEAAFHYAYQVYVVGWAEALEQLAYRETVWTQNDTRINKQLHREFCEEMRLVETRPAPSIDVEATELQAES